MTPLPTREQRSALTQRAAMASIGVAVLLLALKIWAALATGSIAMLGSLADTGLDTFASLVTLFAVRLAAQPADDQHGFGHGKAEALSALFQTALISVSSLMIAWRALNAFADPQPPSHPEFGIGVSLIAIVITFALIRYQHHVVRQTGSVAIHADNIHYSSDLLLNGSVIVALVLSHWMGLRHADPAFGLLIAAWLLWQVVGVTRHALDVLMDKEWPAEKRDHFLSIASAHPELRGIHDFRTRTSGTHDFAQFHIWVDPGMTVSDAHRVMDEVEVRLLSYFPGVEILIHPDPEGHLEPAKPA